MKIVYWTHEGVNPDGTLVGEVGQVGTQPRLQTSDQHHRLAHRIYQEPVEACWWLMVTTGRLPDGAVHGITIFFKNESEMQRFEQTRCYET